jgi:intracellular septation protein
MRFIFDFILILAFFIAYKVWSLYVATAVIMVGSALQLLFHRWHDGKWDKTSLYLAIVIWVLGAFTLGLHDSTFIKWKPTIIYWVISGTCFTSTLMGKTPVLQKLLGNKITLPDFAWNKLNLAWGWFFLFLGALNIYVLMAFSTNVWVYFKLIGCVGLSILFLVAQGFYMVRHMPAEEK